MYSTVEAAIRGVLLKSYSEKFRNIHRKTPVLESFFMKLQTKGNLKN